MSASVFSTLPSHETHAFWFTVTPKRAAEPGTHPITVSITPENEGGKNRKGGRTRKARAEVTLHSVKLKPRKGFPVTNWFYVDSLIDGYGTDQFDERFWELLWPAETGATSDAYRQFLGQFLPKLQCAFMVLLLLWPAQGVVEPADGYTTAQEGFHED